MRLFKKIIALICIIAISLSSLVIPASAVDAGGIGDFVGGVADFGQWVIDTGIYGIKLVERIFNEDICPERPGGVNASHSFVVNTTTKDGVLADWYVCEYCGFNSGYKADSDSFSAAYDDYVAELPATGVDSDGFLYWYLSPSSVYSSGGSFTAYMFVEFYNGYPSAVFHLSGSSTNSTIRVYNCGVDFFGEAPVSGTYFQLVPSGDVQVFADYISTQSASVQHVDLVGKRYLDRSNGHFSSGTTFTAYFCDGSYFRNRFDLTWLRVFSDPGIGYKILPDSALSGDTYNVNTRPTSISGGNYGIVGDNGQITKVEDNSTIVNETNNTFYNPATGQTAPITNWSYDYSDRSYKLTLESGDTVTVTYGNENISILEGDTVYNVYYLVDGSGTSSEPCEHDWQETSRTEPTCTLSGSVVSTCSKCQQTKKEAISALGHDWQVKQTVTTEYDDTGNLTQQGYTIFECSRCHEQYKSPDGTIPPGGGSGTDPGDEGETTIGGLIEKLLSGVGSVVGGIIKGLLSLLTKAVEALAGLAELFSSFVASLVGLWGGFTSFLSAVFPFLPEEFVIILELGLILMIAAAVFRKFFS